MLKPLKTILALTAATVMLGGLAACEKRDPAAGAGPAERAGQQLDQAASRIGEELNKVGEKAGEGMQQAGQALQNKSEEAQKKE